MCFSSVCLFGRSTSSEIRRLSKEAVKLVANEKDGMVKGTKKFIARIKELKSNMGISKTIDGICEKDIPKMARHADKERNPLYPVLMDTKELEKFYRKGMRV